MSTVIRAELSKNNPYYISKHRYYELKHFCLQYNEWKKAYALCNESIIFASNIDKMPSNNIPSDLTAKYANMPSKDQVKQMAYAQAFQGKGGRLGSYYA